MSPEQKVPPRKRRTRAEVLKLVAEFANSGMQRTCRSRRLSFSVLDRHLQKLKAQARKRRRRSASDFARLVPVELTAGTSKNEVGCGLAVLLSGGCRVEVCRDFDVPTLERLLSVLEPGQPVFGLGPATRIYLAVGATDMRKSFEGLYGVVRNRLLCDPLSGHLFVFCNAHRNRLKVLVWDGTGLWVCAKRLEKGRFSWLQSGDTQGKMSLTHEELSLLLGGIDLATTRKKQWYRKGSPEVHVEA